MKYLVLLLICSSAYAFPPAKEASTLSRRNTKIVEKLSVAKMRKDIDTCIDAAIKLGEFNCEIVIFDGIQAGYFQEIEPDLIKAQYNIEENFGYNYAKIKW